MQRISPLAIRSGLSPILHRCGLSGAKETTEAHGAIEYGNVEYGMEEQSMEAGDGTNVEDRGKEEHVKDQRNGNNAVRRGRFLVHDPQQPAHGTQAHGTQAHGKQAGEHGTHVDVSIDEHFPSPASVMSCTFSQQESLASFSVGPPASTRPADHKRARPYA